MADQAPGGSSSSGSMSTEQDSVGLGQQGGALVQPSEVPAPAAGLPRSDLWGIILIVAVVAVVAVIAARWHRRRSR